MRIKTIIVFLLLTFVTGSFWSCKDKQSEAKVSQEEVLPDSSAIDQISGKIRQNPGDHTLFAQRAALKMEENKVEEAIHDMEMAIKIDSMIPGYYVDLAEYELTLGRSQNSKAALDKCVALFPEYTEGLLKLAEIHFLVKQYLESMELIVKAQKLDPLNAQPYFLKGLIYKETGDTIKATENFQIAVNRDPEQYHAYIQLGSLYAGKGDSLALDYFRNALQLQPQSIEAYYNIGMFYQENGFYDLAIKTYHELLKKADGEYVFAFYNIAYIYLEYKKDYTAAIDYFSRAIDIKNNYYQAYHNRGVAYELLGDYEDARINYKQALKILPNFDLSIDALNRLDQKKR